MRLSKHFTLEEMTKSMTAARRGIDNTPGAGEIKNLENVCYEILEPVRAKFSNPLLLPLATGPKRFVRRSAAKRRRNMQKARRLTSKSWVYQILKLLTG